MPEMEERVTALEVGQARLEERVDRLEEDRRKQNGKLDRIEAKLNGFGWAIAATLGGVVVQLALYILRR